MRSFDVLIVTAFVFVGHFALVAAQEKFRAASGGFSTAIHAVAWAAYEKKGFLKIRARWRVLGAGKRHAGDAGHAGE